jgi:ABC-type siderophore export system fused ATPase/permease subunit
MSTERILIQDVPYDYYFKFPSGNTVYRFLHEERGYAVFEDRNGKRRRKKIIGHVWVDVYTKKDASWDNLLTVGLIGLGFLFLKGGAK